MMKLTGVSMGSMFLVEEASHEDLRRLHAELSGRRRDWHVPRGFRFDFDDRALILRVRPERQRHLGDEFRCYGASGAGNRSAQPPSGRDSIRLRKVSGEEAVSG